MVFKEGTESRFFKEARGNTVFYNEKSQSNLCDMNLEVLVRQYLKKVDFSLPNDNNRLIFPTYSPPPPKILPKVLVVWEKDIFVEDKEGN